MAVAFEMRFAGATLEQYDQVVANMGFTPGGPGAEGGLFHWVTADADGIRIVDVWQTPERFEQFGKDHIRPALAEVGIMTEPVISSYPVHNFFTAG